MDAGPDGGRRDTGLRDTGVRDTGVRDAGPPPDASGLTPCRRDSDCMFGVCRTFGSLAPMDLGPVLLFCSPPELDPSGALGSACGDEFACDRHLCTVSGTCVQPCVADPDCPGELRCRETWVPTSSGSMQMVDACVEMVSVPSTVTVDVRPGPSLDGAERTDRLPDLAPNALTVWVGQPDRTLFIFEIRDAVTGAVLFDPFVGGTGAPDWGVGAATTSQVVTMLYPNGPRTPRASGGLAVDLVSMPRTTTDRLIYRRSGPGTIFDIDAYLVGGGSWTLAEGPPVALALALDEARVILRQVGLSIGEVRLHEVVGALRTRYQVLEGEAPPLGQPPELDELYRLSAGGNRPSVNIFFVRMIEGALGIASGIPGPHGMNGTGASGVAIAVDVVPPGELDDVIVHELGHFMGLFHTTELDGSVFEPLGDTAECPASRDSDGDGFLAPFECGGFGADNLLFWTGSGTALSAEQGELMRRAYFVR